MTAPHAARPALASWRAAVFIVFALNGLTMATWVARTPAIRDALGVRTDQFGLLIVGMAIGSILGLLSSSHVIARFGTRRVITVGLMTTSFSLALVGIGVEPVWADQPSRVTSYQRMPCTPVTTPIIFSSASRIGPCSM